ncbi:peptide-methionine (R)-S-oxide reductase MsrB [Rufibacter ruber]|uniref:peptide-methionine (R)-S-oxide reductase MsrB n=1 Tax=Rufibacter ruber TaxID=1783499 RepID=UPI000942E84B|nr:peptide-methionine (R)-S-oxide reductase MsrB [Rufibacter ruber]
MKPFPSLLLLLWLGTAIGCTLNAKTAPLPLAAVPARTVFGDTLSRTEEYWRQTLTPEQFFVLREKGTERPFSGQYHAHQAQGMYHCAGCGQALFSSEAKFDSGTGWPSFFTPVSAAAVRQELDTSAGVEQVEVLCRSCGGHLGHVFADGPKPTGLRYCLNSSALAFVKR